LNALEKFLVCTQTQNKQIIKQKKSESAQFSLPTIQIKAPKGKVDPKELWLS
jgi:hypothetical protein